MKLINERIIKGKGYHSDYVVKAFYADNKVKFTGGHDGDVTFYAASQESINKRFNTYS